MRIICTKGFVIDGALAIMKGEMFKLINSEENTFEGIEGKSRCPGMEIDFTEEQLANYFELFW
jgi:hypothetical protein